MFDLNSSIFRVVRCKKGVAKACNSHCQGTPDLLQGDLVGEDRETAGAVAEPELGQGCQDHILSADSQPRDAQKYSTVQWKSHEKRR